MTYSLIKTARRNWFTQSRAAALAPPKDIVVFGSPRGIGPARAASFRAAVSRPMAAGATGRELGRSDPWWQAVLSGWPFHGFSLHRPSLHRPSLHRPALIVTEGFGLLTALACIYRWLSRRVTLVVFVTEPPDRLGLIASSILRVADGVLVDSEAAALAMSKPGSPARTVCRIAPDYHLDRFLQIAPTRSADQARRIIVMCDLTPGSGAADLLVAVTAWSEAHPGQAVELNWIGEGDMAGLLAAQPLPDNLSQLFLGLLDPGQVAASFARCGLLVMPSIVEDMHAPIAEALAAGLPVLGSRRSRDIRHLVADGVNGWLFDPLTTGDMLDGVTRALGTSGQLLDGMRTRARDAVSPAPSGHPLARLPRRDISPLPGLHPAAQRAP